MHGKPKIVCLCGSTRFREAFEAAQKAETLAGRIVLSVGMFGHHEGLDMDGPVKAALDELHLRKIDLADEVLVLNPGGYIGQSTRRELEYARAHGKAVRFLVGDDDGPFTFDPTEHIVSEDCTGYPVEFYRVTAWYHDPERGGSRRCVMGTGATPDAAMKTCQANCRRAQAGFPQAV